MSELLTELFLASLVFDLLSSTLRTQMFFVIKLFNYYSTKYEDPRGVAKGGAAPPTFSLSVNQEFIDLVLYEFFKIFQVSISAMANFESKEAF